MNDRIQDYFTIMEAREKLHKLQMDHWRQHELFTYQWWALLALLILPWLLWLRLVDRRRTGIILSYGFLIMFLVIFMDVIGTIQGYWIYPIKLVPVIPHIIPIDWSMLPVLQMLIFQYFPRWKEFITLQIIVAALLAFLGEPFAEWIGIYHVFYWEHYWSFPIYFIKAIVAKWIIERIIYRSKSLL